MRRCLVTAFLIFAAAILPSAANAQAATADSVTGHAIDGLFVDSPDGDFWIYDTEFVVDAHSGPSGANPRGTVRVNICYDHGANTCEWGGDVTCMNVQGNRAVVGFFGPIVGRFEGPTRVRGYVEVVDNGPASERADTIKWANLSRVTNFGGPPPAPFTTCPPDLRFYPTDAGPLPPPRGPFDGPQDLTVVDAQPNGIANRCIQQRGNVRFSNPQCKRTIPRG